MSNLDLRPPQGVWNAVQGSGGKSSEAPDSLFSKGVSQVLDLIGEGPIQGLANGPQSIFFNNVPFADSNGKRNFTGASYAVVYGYPDQPYLPGFSAVAQQLPQFSSARVSKNIGPVTNRVTDLNADAAIVTISCPALIDGRKSKGARGTSVELVVEVAANAASPNPIFQQAVLVWISGKSSTQYSEDYRLNLSAFGPGPWDIRVARVTDDSTDDRLQNETDISDVQVVYDHKFNYPNSALVGTTVDAQYFGSTSPTRSFDILGLIISVPSNYDPINRTYTGLWDGTFKQAWTNNPAWIFYDLVTNKRYGLGLSPAYIDKWGLYTIAQYCDGVDGNGAFVGVPDGFGGMEPRFTYNGVIKDQKAAFDVLNSMASTFRGMVYWSAGLVSLTQDAPRDPVKVFNQANVIDGNFEYSGSSKLARNTVYVVEWMNPANGYLSDYEVVEDPTGIASVGYRVKSVQAYGCTSRGQARRFGRWALAAESLQLDTVRFVAGYDGSDAVPGTIVSVADPAYAGVRMGGRIMSAAADGSHLTLDMPFDFVGGHNYEISLILENGAMFTAGVANAPGTSSTVQLVANLDIATLPINGAVFNLVDLNSVQPRLFQVMSRAEKEHGSQFEIIALEQNNVKFQIADNAASFDTTAANQFQNLPKAGYTPPPVNVQAVYETLTDINGNALPVIHLSWEPPADYPMIQGYVAGYKRDDDNWVMLQMAGATAADFENPGVGNFTLRVNAVNFFGVPSSPVYVNLNIAQNGATNLNLISNLETAQGGGDFTGPNCAVTWEAAPISAPTADPGNGVDAYFNGFRVNVYEGTTPTLLRTEYVNTPAYTYTIEKNQADNAGRSFTIGVATRSIDGTFSGEAKLHCQNPAPVVTNAQLSYDYHSLRLSYPEPDDPDFVGVSLWVSTTPNFTPGPDNLVYQGSGQPDIQVWSLTYYYVQWCFYDMFGTAGCPLTPQQMIFTPNIPFQDLDLTPPATPTGLVLATSTQHEADGTPYAEITATWNASTSQNAGGYALGVTEASGNEIVYITPKTSYTLRVRPGRQYSIRVQAYSLVDIYSAWSPSQLITSATDLSVPGSPSAVSATHSLASIFLSWTNDSLSTLDHVDVYESATNNFATAVIVGTVTASASSPGGFARTGLKAGDTRYYWLKSVTTSGVASVFSIGVSDTVPGINPNDFSSGTQPLSTVSALPNPTGYTGPIIVWNAADGLLYRYVNGAWTTSVPAASVTGQITTTQIAPNSITTSQIVAGAITAAQIATGTITASQMAVGTITADRIATGTITATQIAAQTITGTQIAAQTITGTNIAGQTITATNIQTGTITASQIAAGSITADRLLASTITATQIAANTIQGQNIAGQTITGNNIAAGTITAQNIQAGTLTATQIAANSITGDRITAGTLYADRIVAGTITTAHMIANSISAPTYYLDQSAIGLTNIDQVVAQTSVTCDDSEESVMIIFSTDVSNNSSSQNPRTYIKLYCPDNGQYIKQSTNFTIQASVSTFTHVGVWQYPGAGTHNIQVLCSISQTNINGQVVKTQSELEIMRFKR